MSTAGDYFLCLGGQEIYNLCRTQALMAAGFGPAGMVCRGCGCCDNVPGGLGFPNGLGNIADAPWYDPNVPESAEFAGLLVTGITGLEGGRFGRTVTETGSVSTVFGRARRAAPEIVVTGLIMASTCCGQDFGFQWLNSALGGNGNCSGSAGCLGDDLTFLACIPGEPDEDCLLNPGEFTTQNFPLADVIDNFLPMPTTVRPIPLPVLTLPGRYKLTLSSFTAIPAGSFWTQAIREVGVGVKATQTNKGLGLPVTKTLTYEFFWDGTTASPTFQAEFSAGPGNGGINISQISATIEAVQFDREAWLSPYFRTFKRAVLVDGPFVNQLIPRGCPECYDCCIYEVQFTIRAGNPCIYRDPIDLGTESFLCVFEDECQIDWIPPGAGRNCKDFSCKATTTDCATDPLCSTSSAPSVPDPPPAGCGSSCEPSSDVTCCSVIQVDASAIPDHASATLRLEIFAGSQPMRHVKIKLWANPLSLPVDQLDDCDACSILGVNYIADETTLVIDGSTRTMEIECVGGQTVRANRFVANTGGAGRMQYPDLACGDTNYTIQVCSPEFTAADSTFKASLIIKEGC